MTKLEKENRDLWYAFTKKTLRNARERGAHITRTIHLPASMMCQLSYYTVQLQVWRVLVLHSPDWLKLSAFFM